MYLYTLKINCLLQRKTDQINSRLTLAAMTKTKGHKSIQCTLELTTASAYISTECFLHFVTECDPVSTGRTCVSTWWG